MNHFRAFEFSVIDWCRVVIPSYLRRAFAGRIYSSLHHLIVDLAFFVTPAQFYQFQGPILTPSTEYIRHGSDLSISSARLQASVRAVSLDLMEFV